MPYPKYLRRSIALLVCLSACISVHAQADEEFLGDDALMMDAFKVSVYGGKIPINDGLTGKKYDGDNQVVIDFALSFNKLLLAYHQKLVIDEYKHMEFRLKLGDEFEYEMNTLSLAFNFDKFELDRSQWMTRERAIVSRLINKPFFKISSLIAWDIDRLNEMAPARPKSKYVDDIHFDPESQSWQRRVTAKWEVFFRPNYNNPKNAFHTQKEQGLNLDTLKGFHYIERGLPGNVPSNAFLDVKLTYPIFYSDNNISEEELRRLQEAFIANLYYIYDPFSWIARRETRFRGGFRQECQKHIEGERIYVSDRKWFDANFSRFLSDAITIKLQGVEEIHALQMTSKHFNESPQVLGAGVDLLNWNRKEKREATSKPEAPVRISAKFRYAMIDAYLRFGDAFIGQIQAQLAQAKASRNKINGQQMIKTIIADQSGMSFNAFSKRAVSIHESLLLKHKVTG